MSSASSCIGSACRVDELDMTGATQIEQQGGQFRSITWVYISSPSLGYWLVGPIAPRTLPGGEGARLQNPDVPSQSVSAMAILSVP